MGLGFPHDLESSWIEKLAFFNRVPVFQSSDSQVRAERDPELYHGSVLGFIENVSQNHPKFARLDSLNSLHREHMF